METDNSITLGYTINPRLLSTLFQNRVLSYDTLIDYLSRKNNTHGRLLLLLKQYLEQKFGTINIFFDFEISRVFPNGTLSGLFQKINRSEVNIGVQLLGMNETLLKVVDFTYPFKLADHTFMTHKPEYRPETFGIFQCFRMSVWFTMVSTFIAMVFVCYFIFKKKCKFSEIFFNVFAILMKQNAQVRPSSFAEKLFIYSWVVGTMILCLSYDSTFLAFLSIPPVTKIKHLSDLASAVQNGYYHCLGSPWDGIAEHLWDANQENLRIIANDMFQNNIRYTPLLTDFILGNKSTNLAFFLDTTFLESFAGKFFISEDRFFESLRAMIVSRDFCCKDLIDKFVHRMMASGIYLKFINDLNFIQSLFFSGNQEKETSIRILTLTDVAPAIIFLLCGYIISFLVFIGEILLARKNLRYSNRNKRKRTTKLFIKNSV